MDYKTHPASREDLRRIAKWVRRQFKCKSKYRFDVIDAFEKAPLLFSRIICTVVEDEDIEGDVPARCTLVTSGKYLIEVKNSIYEGAVAGIGGYRAHILHEICHAILCILGFTPVLDRTFKNKELRPFESMEWQAKALCGEIMIPYEDTVGLSIRQIKNYCNVSYDAAAFRYFDFKKTDTQSDDNTARMVYYTERL